VFPALPAGAYLGIVQVVGKGFIGAFNASVSFWVGSV
jgi:hypothetical protein